MAGRPTKLTPELSQRVIDLVRVGNYVETAAAAVGVHRNSLFNWMERGRKDESGAYFDFVNGVHQAQAEAEARTLAVVQRAGKEGDWQAATWILERRHPARYAQRLQLKVEQELERALNKLKDALDANTYNRVCEALACEAGPAGASGVEEGSRAARDPGVDPDDLS